MPAGTTTWVYDGRGQLTRQDNPNATRATYAYDAIGRTLQIRHSNAGTGAEIERAFYRYDAIGRPLAKQTLGGTHTYQYDALDQLTSEELPDGTITTWTYDAAYRRRTQLAGAALTTYSYDAADELSWHQTGAAYTTYTYDPNGSVLVRQAPPDVRTSFTWDASNRLASVQTPGGTIYSHTYRHDGLRHSRQSPTTTYVTLHEAAAMEEGLSREVGNLPGGGAANRAYHLDAQGSVAAVTDANQSTVTRYETDAWGNVLSGLVADEPAIYGGGLGYWYDPDLALYYVKARWLDPATGRWLSVDPVESEPRYTYVANQPTTRVDPTGERGEPSRFRRLEGWIRSEAQAGEEWVAGAARDAEAWFEAEAQAHLSPEAIVRALQRARDNPMLWASLAGLPGVGPVVAGGLASYRVLVLAQRIEKLGLATYNSAMKVLPEAIASAVPKDQKAFEAWRTEMVKWFALGFVNEAISTLTLAGAIQLIESLLEDIQFFEQAGVSPESIWKHYVDDPVLDTLKAIAQDATVSASILGSILGSLSFIILLTVLQMAVEAALTAPAGGSGAVAGLAYGGTRFAQAVRTAQRWRETVSIVNQARRLSKAGKWVEKARGLQGKLGQHMHGGGPYRFRKLDDAWNKLKERVKKLRDAAPRRKGRGVWDLPWNERGRRIEQMLGANIPVPNFPVIDRIVAGTITSIKSIDLEVVSRTTLRDELSEYVRHLRRFPPQGGKTVGGVTVMPSAVQRRVLEVAVPPRSMSAAQRDVFNFAASQAAKRHALKKEALVDIVVVEVK